MNDTGLIQSGNLALLSAKSAHGANMNARPEMARKTAQDFEAFFLGQMLQPMFANLSAEGPFGGGHAEKIWRAMMVDEVGKAMAKSGGIGLADYVQREILRVQEAQSA